MTHQKQIVSPEYPNGILVDLTSEEITQREQDAIQAEQDRLAYEAEKQAKANAKASALAKLSALGLTEEEVQAIIK
jgi:hypothetical protein